MELQADLEGWQSTAVAAQLVTFRVVTAVEV